MRNYFIFRPIQQRLGIMKKSLLLKICLGLAGIIAGIVIIRTGGLVYPIERTAHLVLSPEQYQANPPAAFGVFNTLTGIAGIVAGLVLIGGSLAGRMTGFRFAQLYRPFLLTIIIILIALLSLVSLQKTIEPDEIEHIHSSWYITHGAIPYADFFQHHNPLLWYCLAPLLLALGEGAHIIFLFRGLMCLVIISTGFLVYLIARETGMSKNQSLIPVILLLSTVPFLKRAMEIRPDGPMVLFILIAVYFSIRYLKDTRNVYLIYCGLFLSLAFLFLQKASIFIVLYGLALITAAVLRKIKIRDLSACAIAFLLPLLAFLLELIFTKSLSDYYYTNVLLNLEEVVGSQKNSLNSFILQNGLHSVLFLIALFYSLFYPGSMRRERYVAVVLAVVGLLYPIILNRTAERNFLPAIPLLCITAGYFLDSLFRARGWGEDKRAVLLIVIILIPLFFLIKSSAINYNRDQMRKIKYVLDHTHKDDRVYDGQNRFNLFRPNIHYFWFSSGKKGLLKPYNRITGGKYADYDLVSLIDEKRPKITSDAGYDFSGSGLSRWYEETPFKGLYIRK